MLTLHQFPTAFNVPNLSTFCMKLETYLRMTSIPYEVSEFTNPNIAPKGKGPFISDDDQKMGDSSLIIDYLNNKHGVNLDADLSDTDKSLSHSFKILLEERLYWIIVYSRWADDTNWPLLKELFFGDIPWPVSLVIPNMVRKSVIKNLHVIGISRHTDDEIYAFAKQDINALACQLGGKDYFLGNEPHEIDAAVYATVSNLMINQFTGPLLEEVNKHQNLVDYQKRMKKRFYG